MIYEESGLKKLARNLLIQAGKDWDTRDTDTWRYRYRRQIKDWSKTDDFKSWCDMASLDWEVIIKKFKD